MATEYVTSVVTEVELEQDGIDVTSIIGLVEMGPIGVYASSMIVLVEMEFVPISKYSVGIGHNIDGGSLINVAPQLTTPGLQITRRTHGHTGDINDDFIFVEWKFNVLGSIARYQSVLAQFDLIDNIEANVTITTRDNTLAWKRYNGVAVRPEQNEDIRWTDFMPKDITILIKELEELA